MKYLKLKAEPYPLAVLKGVPGSIYINGILYNLRTRQDGTPLMRSTGEYLYRKA